MDIDDTHNINDSFEYKSFDEFVNESIKTKAIGTVGTDTASFLIVDPAYIKKEHLKSHDTLMDKMLDMKKKGKDGKYTFSGIQGDGYLHGTGADGGYQLVGIYDDEIEDKGMPIAIMLKLRDGADDLQFSAPGENELKLNPDLVYKHFVKNLTDDQIKKIYKKLNGKEDTNREKMISYIFSMID